MTDLSVYAGRYNFAGNLAQALDFVGGSWGEHEAYIQPDFMKKHGLMPEHSFLDLACGCLRGTAPLVDYLDDGNFYGADVSSGLISVVPERLKTLGISKTPKLKVISDFNLSGSFQNQRFDYVLSVSLLTHLYPDVIPSLFSGVSGILNPKGVWYFTIYPCETVPGRGNIELHYYNKYWLMEVGQDNGLAIKDMDEGIHRNETPGSSGSILPYKNTTLGQWTMEARLA